jgi:UDP-MurNAc hydroxylase
MKKLSITHIAHACVSIKDDDFLLLTDPWFFGKTFNNGWELDGIDSVEIDFAIRNVTHIYISHEHPDHFHPPTIKEILKYSSPIFLIQYTRDKRVFDYLKNIGALVTELKDGEYFYISQNATFRLWSHGHLDSYSVINYNSLVFLNLNDCILKSEFSLKEVQRNIKSSVDVLLTQFSFASYQGNPEEIRKLKSASIRYITYVADKTNFFRPKVILLFASNILFCHPENFYLNKYRVDINELKKELLNSSNSTFIVSPSERYNEIVREVDLYVTSSIVAQENLTAYEFDKIRDGTNIDFINLFSEFKKRIMEQNKGIKILYWILYKINFLRKLTLKVKTYNGEIFYSIDNFFEIEKITPEKTPDVELSSDSLYFILKNNFGIETLWVNSRLRINSQNKLHFIRLFYPSVLNNQGFFFPFGFLCFLYFRVVRPFFKSLL